MGVSDPLRIGCGAGFSSDRLEPAIDLARDGELHWLAFETLGERTLAFAHRDRQANDAAGFNPHLAARLRGILPHTRANGARIITNMGAANPTAAGAQAIEVARELGLKGLTVAVLEGDDLTKTLPKNTALADLPGRTISDAGYRFIGANAYLGIDAILPAIETGADIIITGRVADPSLFLAPAVARFGWTLDDWPRLGQGTLAGHLLECGMQITGGYFADPGVKDVPRLADCGFPIGTIEENGDVTISKLADAGGLIDQRTVKEQMLYEVHDPARYLTPDVTADFSRTRLTDVAPHQVRATGASGTNRPEKLKVTVGFDGGFLGEAGISYAGINALRRAGLARDILTERLKTLENNAGQCRIDLIGVDAIHATTGGQSMDNADVHRDVRVRAAVRTSDRQVAETMLWEVEALLCCGPAGGGGYRGQITPSVTTFSAFVDRGLVSPKVTVLTA